MILRAGFGFRKEFDYSHLFRSSRTKYGEREIVKEQKKNVLSEKSCTLNLCFIQSVLIVKHFSILIPDVKYLLFSIRISQKRLNVDFSFCFSRFNHFKTYLSRIIITIIREATRIKLLFSLKNERI